MSAELSKNTIIIGGVEFDNPIGKELSKRDVRKWKEGTRTNMIGLNMLNYHKEGEACVCWQYEVSLSNYGSAYLEGKQLKGEDVETVKKLFKELKLI